MNITAVILEWVTVLEAVVILGALAYLAFSELGRTTHR